jgi:predicted DsbA family dithiol-disulfide isomerase
MLPPFGGWHRRKKAGAMSTALPSSAAAAELVAAPLFVDVVSDVVCPWCYIGKRKLETALARLRAGEPDLAATVRWHPFELNPDLPVEGIPRVAYLEKKFGGKARAAEIYARVRAVGTEVGIAFEFERIERQPNTRDAHRLLAWAQQQRGDAGALVECLFRAYFIEGRWIGDRDLLAALAADNGLPRDEAQAMLASDAYRAEVDAEYREAQEAGITGVPFFIFNGRTAVSGAHDPDVLLEAIAAARANA